MRKQASCNSTVAALAVVTMMATASGRLPADVLQADVVINGGTLSAPAVALQAARTWPDAHILLVEPTDWLGGQATSQGVAAIDNAWHAPGAALMRDNPATYYPADYLDFLTRIKNAPALAPGEGYGGDGCNWVSREAFDPRTGAWVLDQMMAEVPNLTVLRMTVVKDAATEAAPDAFGAGRRITALTLVQRTPAGGYVPFTKFLSQEIPDWYATADSADFTKQVHTVAPRDAQRGLVVVDASELADVVVLSGADYVVGRESTTERMNEDGTPPAHDEDGSQAFVFPFCMTTATTTDAETSLRAQWADFNTYYSAQLTGFFGLGTTSWRRVWTYRRLKNTGAPFQFDAVNAGDVTMQNWNPGNDYPYNTLYKVKSATAAELPDWAGGVNLAAIAEAEKHAVAFYFYMKQDAAGKPGTLTDTRFLRGDDALNMMGSGSGLSKFPYIRCTRRILGLHNFRLTERYWAETSSGSYPGGASFRYYDSVGIGNYAADVHGTRISSGIAPTRHTPAPFYVPYRALASSNVRNLVVAGKLAATTYVTNSAYRLHPIEWAMGSAAGAAAAQMARDAITNYDLLEEPALRALQNSVRANSPIHWAAYDTAPVPTQNGELIINDLANPTAGRSFRIEVYHHRGNRARLYQDDVFLGETTTRANGRLVFDVASAPEGTRTYRADVFIDPVADVEDVLTATATVEPAAPLWIMVDDADPAPAFVLAGSGWGTSSNADRYASSARIKNNGTTAHTATWTCPTRLDGEYEVVTVYPAASNRSNSSPFSITHAGGTTLVRVNQRTSSEIPGIQWQGRAPGTWLRGASLGTFTFAPGADAVVRLQFNITDAAANYIVADAIGFRKIDAATPTPSPTPTPTATPSPTPTATPSPTTTPPPPRGDGWRVQ